MPSKVKRDPYSPAVLPCPYPGCKWKVKIFGTRDDGRDTTFHIKPRRVPSDLPNSVKPWAVSRSQRRHFAWHASTVAKGTREEKYVEWVLLFV